MDDLDELSRRLWLLREQLEQLACALDIQQLVLSNNRLRWLPAVSDNVEHIVEDILASEVERAATSQRIAQTLGLAEEATLVDLSDAVGEPHSSVWMRHRSHLLSLQMEIDGLTSTNNDLGRRGIAAAREMLGSMRGDAIDTYDPRGGTEPLTPTSPRFDRTA